MPEIIHHRSPVIDRSKGVALLMVLLIVLAITIIATGFLADADTELICGGNMLLRTQMDQLAYSALEHAKGLLLHPQEVPPDRNGLATYWVGEAAQQLIAGSQDYYDVSVEPSDPADSCTYDVTYEAYRLDGLLRTGRSRLAATLRIDPCIALWANGDVVFRNGWMLQGDLRSTGSVLSLAPTAQAIDGDVFSTSLTGSIVGQHLDLGPLSLPWPSMVTTGYSNPAYADCVLSGPLSSQTCPPAIWRSMDDLVLAGDVTIRGMLLVTGNLTVRGQRNKIVAAKNLPALYVSGNLVIEDVNDLRIEGLAVVDGDVRISAAASNVTVLGGLFVNGTPNGTLIETATDASGNGHTGLLKGNPQWVSGQWGGALRLDGVDDYVDCGTSPALDITEQITVAAWVNTKDTGNNNQDNPYVTKGHSYGLKNYNGHSILFSVAPAGSVQYLVTTAFNDEWHHVVGTYDRTEIRLYVDSAAPVVKPGTDPINPTALRVFIGSDHLHPGDFYQGAIDDVRIYSRALTLAEIDAIRAGEPVTNNLMARWTLDGPGSTVKIVAEPMKAAIVSGMPGSQTCWSQAAAGFFKSIRRLQP